MGDLSDFEVGQTVELQDGRTATVRFIGCPQFAPGDWIGVELDDASGKNDGSVQGHRYFDCDAGHGMFVRPGVAAIIDQPTPRAIKRAVGPSNRGLVKPRQSIAPSTGLRRQSIMDSTAGKRESINGGSPTPSARSAASSRGLRASKSHSPSKSPTKQLSSTMSSGNSTPRLTQSHSLLKPSLSTSKPRAVVGSRSSIGPGPGAGTRNLRQSIAGTLNGTAKPTLSSSRRPANRLSTLQQGQARSSSLSGESQASGESGQESPLEAPERNLLSPPGSGTSDGQSVPVISPILSRSTTLAPDSFPSHRVSSPNASQRPAASTPASSTVSHREVEDLRTKLRMMEKRRLEDREKLKVIDKIQGERDKFEGIIQKLQAKYQPQQQEIADLKRQIKEAESRANADETRQAEIDAAMEMATLDREMAEETAEVMKTELDALKQKFEELELEVDILREENSELCKEMTPEERTSQGWAQMERSNERLREALLRLRDVTQEQESALRQEIKELETEVQDLSKLRPQFQETKERLQQSETINDSLRQQLDTALGAEEMLEELTEKNLSLNERLDTLKIAIEDLESLKELNDELEINHIETEKQMQDEIDYKDIIVQEESRKVTIQDQKIEDLEYTVSRFRELVTNLQNDLEDMRASQQITETEASELSSRSRAMLDLNMRLQVSANKTQVKTIDLELKRLEAQESAEHLAILQLFLPDTIVGERESVNTLLRIKRIGFKSNLLHIFVKERLNSPGMAGHEDDIFASCEILENLTWISAMCDRFNQHVQSCSLEAFQRLGSAYFDLEPVERGLNSWIDGLKRDEIKEQQCAAELQRSIALFTHLAEVHISESLHQWAEDIRMHALLVQSSLENSAAALLVLKTMAQSRVSGCDSTDQDVVETVQSLFKRLDLVIGQIRSAKVVSSKSIHQLRELRSHSLTLDLSTMPIIEQAQKVTSELFSVCCQSGISLFKTINQDGRTSMLSYDEVIKAIAPSDSPPLSSLFTRLSIVTSHVQSFYNATMTLSESVEFAPPGPAPWDLVARTIRAASATSASHESEIERLKDELLGKNTALAMKDKIVEEMSVNVEVLEKRVGESGGRREKLRELEESIELSKTNERNVARKLAALEQELRGLRAEREIWKQEAQANGLRASRGPRGHDIEDPLAKLASAKVHETVVQLKAEIEILQSTIRHMRRTTHQVTISSSHTFLAKPLVSKAAPTKQQQLACEAQDMLQSMMALVARPENQLITLKPSRKEERLSWRPAKESPQWQVGRQREEWEGWRDWRNDLVKRSEERSREEGRRRAAEQNRGEGLANVGFYLPQVDGKSLDPRRDVRIVRPGDWEELERSLGVT